MALSGMMAAATASTYILQLSSGYCCMHIPVHVHNTFVNVDIHFMHKFIL